jgi:hypothetical protein
METTTRYPEEEKLNRAEWEAKDAMERLKNEANHCEEASRRLGEQADGRRRGPQSQTIAYEYGRVGCFATVTQV